MNWTQIYDPLGHWWLSTLVAALPIVVLLGLLAGFRVKPHLAAMAGAITALLIAYFVFKMPASLAGMSFLYGFSFGPLEILLVLVAAAYLYELTAPTRHIEIMKESLDPVTSGPALPLFPG